MKAATASNAIVAVVSAYAEGLAELQAEVERLRKQLAAAHDELARLQMDRAAAMDVAKR